MECRKCGACCIAPSISSEIPGMKKGKQAGIRCKHLGEENMCKIYNNRPEVCKNFSPTKELCGASFNDAMKNLSLLESQTS